MKKLYSVYIHVNLFNNCVYIGLTSSKPKKRWNKGKNYKTNKLFSTEINFYGWDNFSHTIMLTTSHKEMAEEVERKQISKYRKLGICYNLESGGYSNYTISESTRNKLKNRPDIRNRKIKRYNNIKKYYDPEISNQKNLDNLSKHNINISPRTLSRFKRFYNIKDNKYNTILKLYNHKLTYKENLISLKNKGINISYPTYRKILKQNLKIKPKNYEQKSNKLFN